MCRRAGNDLAGDVLLKRCPDCGLVQPLERFGRNASTSDGRAFYCKSCFSRRAAESYRRRQAAQGKTVRERPVLPPGHLRCAQCSSIKPLEDFHRAARQANGRSSYCKTCKLRRDEDARLRRLYGLTRQQVEDWREAQDGLCAVCRKHPAKHVDHSHRTGRVRGMTCFRCNAALGQFGDDVDVLRRAIAYLQSAVRFEQVDAGVHVLHEAVPIGPSRPPTHSHDALVSLLQRGRALARAAATD